MTSRTRRQNGHASYSYRVSFGGRRAAPFAAPPSANSAATLVPNGSRAMDARPEVSVSIERTLSDAHGGAIDSRSAGVRGPSKDASVIACAMGWVGVSSQKAGRAPIRCRDTHI